MGHSQELLTRIAVEVRRFYPEPEYRFVFEKGLYGTDRRNQPDIQVWDARDAVVCAVEIGYTRPEKLALYRDAGIPDVRWYSKGGDLLSLPAFRDPGPLVREIKYAAHPSDAWNHYSSWGASCPALGTAAIPLLNDVAGQLKVPGGRFAALRKLARGCREIEVLSDHELDPLAALKAIEAGQEDCWDELLVDFSDVYQEFWSNGSYLLRFHLCDFCKDSGIEYEPLAILVENDAPWDLKDFEKRVLVTRKMCRAARIPAPSIPTLELDAHFAKEWGVDLDMSQLTEWDLA